MENAKSRDVNNIGINTGNFKEKKTFYK